VISTLCGPHREVRKESPGSFMGYFTGRAALIAEAGISHTINRKEEPNF